MKKKSVILVFLICIFPFQLALSQTGITRNDYYNHIKESFDDWYSGYKVSVEEWERADPSVRAVNRPSPHCHHSRAAGLIFKLTGETKYAEITREVLLNMRGTSDNYYTWQAIKHIEKSGILTENDLKIIRKKMEKGAEDAIQYWAEWGAMNHCTNHIINNLTVCLKYMPNHPDIDIWRQKRDINLSSSWGLWSIEDSQIYIPVWIQPLMQYAELEGREKEFYSMPVMKYYFDYLVQLMTPEGQIVEFGDGRYGSGYTWYFMISVLEKAAAWYGDGRMKWAARRLFEAHVKEMGHVNFTEMVNAYLWADDSVKEEVPNDKSRLVLEDYIGKKVVLRSGWDPDATYLFLNFMDDPAFGVDGKEHMIYTINVEAEKNHHGHADENSICNLMKDGSVLLHDGNYRETMSTGPDGQWRADVFHNKLVVRDGLADPDWRMMPFLFNGGRYPFVTTKLMHFRRFRDVDISRTRVTYEKGGYQWDRLINYVKEKEWFIINDFVKILKDGNYTLANLYYTQHITGFDVNNPIWYDTYYSTISDNPIKNKSRLLVYFPEGSAFRIGAEELRRNAQRETAMYAAKADSFKAGDIVVFTTFLIPHPKDKPPEEIIKSLSGMKIFHKGNGYGIKLPSENGYVQFNAMIDLEAEYLKANIRPRYNFESGRAEYGSLVTDARYCYLNKKGNELFYSFLKASRLDYDGKNIFQAGGILHGQDNGIWRKPGISKWVAWEDRVKIEN